MSSLRDLLDTEIRERGGIPFNRFMERALYCPEAGYYEHFCHTPGRGGDYFTSVSVGPLFGRFLAQQFIRWAADAAWPEWSIVECGAQDGQLAHDILTEIEACFPSGAIR